MILCQLELIQRCCGAAVDGAVEQLIIDNRGSGNTNNATYYCPVVGDGTTDAIAKIVINGSGGINTVEMERVGAGYTRTKKFC